MFTWLRIKGQNRYTGRLAGWESSQDGYIWIRLNGRLYAAHRLVWLYVYGEFPPEFIDHINHIRNDNKLKNLRCVSHAENMKNRPLTCKNTSGYSGINYNAKNKAWQINIGVKGKSKTLGYRKDLEDAIKIRKAAEKNYGYHENNGK